ncbi:MAG: AAA domain-containing protein, partial [Propionibacteriaceae bacterium]
YKARTIVEESGANNLYLALGSMVWSLDSRPLRSPLILVPVQLKPAARGGLYRVSLDESGASVPNFCLLEKLRQVHGLEIPELAEPTDDGTGIDLNGALHAVRLALNQAELPYRVEETAHLAILQFAKFRLWKDLDEHWSTFAQNALVQHLIETPNEPFVDLSGDAGDVPGRDLDELAADCPVAADSSQLAAVADAVAGKTFVIEGPPGTGKSQTITNLLTRAMVEGRRVLFVAEKRAALDVVRRRLDDVGMGTFSLDLHDKGSKPAVVRAQIKAALDAAPEFDAQGLAVSGERLRSARQSLARYASNLHAANPAGLSYYSAHTSALALADVPHELVVPPHLVGDSTSADVMQTVRRALVDLPDTADLVNPRPQHPWGFVGLTDPAELDVTTIREACRDLDTAVRLLPPEHQFSAVLHAVRTVEELATAASIATAPRSQLWVLDDVRNSFWEPAVLNARQRTVDFAQRWQRELGPAFPAVLELPLAEIHRQAEEAAASGFFGRKKRLRAVLDQLRPGLQPDADVAPRDVPALARELLLIQQAAQELRVQIDQIPGLTLSQGWNPLQPDAAEEVDGQAGWLQWAAEFVAPDASSPAGQALRGFLAAEQTIDPTEQRTLSALVVAAEQLARVCASTSEGLDLWSGPAGLISTWVSTTNARDLQDPQLLPVRRWVSFLAAVEPLRRAGFTQAWADLRQGAVRADDAVQAFDRGLATASSIERANATGLAAFDVAVQDKTVGRFTGAAEDVREQLWSALPSTVVERRTFNSLNESGRIGALRRELSKLRRGMSVRTLVGRYGDLITQVMPCVLVSPDSLSRFFPARADLFDLVVFDEASQIRVADAIGAIGRARSVVVVGDSKQMPPTSFGEAALDLGESGSDDDDVLESWGVVEDEESILSECVQARVPRHWLSWHYRSQDESLIAFSNALYYEDRLSSFPSPHVGAVGPTVDGVGVSLVRVAGQFERSRGPGHRTNAKEAERIVEEVRLRFDASPGAVPSIGIVTFNVQQRTLIESLLRDSEDERLVEALDQGDEGLFVKNLENVQGDERDVIFFSTAFSVDKNGKLPLNFGPLNREGGERRLNVAVTRARRQVIVFSSFDPEQLRSEETSSRGIKDLRAYLDMAAHGPGVLTSLLSRPRRPSPLDRHREQLAEVLRERGLVVSTNIGLSDFRIDLTLAQATAPDQPRVAVLLDGPGWAGRGTVGDRDGLPVEVLSRMMRWPAVERVWLPAWIADPEPIVERLLAAAARPDPVPTSAPAPRSGDPEEDLLAEPDGDLSYATEPSSTEPSSTEPSSTEPSSTESG